MSDQIDPARRVVRRQRHSPYYGYGQVNAAAALQEAARRRSD